MNKRGEQYKTKPFCLLQANNASAIISHIVAFFICIFVFNACNSDFLEKEPLDKISDATVWNDPDLIDAYVTQLYHRAPTRRLFSGGYQGNDSHAEPHSEPGELCHLSDEARCSYLWATTLTLNRTGFDRNTGMEQYWDYGLVRACNEFFEKVENAGNIDDEIKTHRIAEVRFIRAFVYFEMVKRYGGVPIVTKAQAIDAPDEELFLYRNTEKEVYDFVISECEWAVELFDSVKPLSNEKGRADRFTALALKSRAALYAASIAKYGTVQLDGIVGIPNEYADSYWQKSYDASFEIIDKGGFLLYDIDSDKAENYQNIFLTEGKSNPEIIFSRQFVGADLGHSFDYYNAPHSFKGTGWGSHINPTLDLVNAFEMIDGSQGEIDWSTQTNSLENIFLNKDPRLRASIFFNGAEWKNDSIVTWSYIEADTGAVDGVYVKFDSNTGKYTDPNSGIIYDHVGKDVYPIHRDGTKTGFFIKKFLTPDYVVTGRYENETDWIEFRLAEILLNYAEAAFELNQPDEALNVVNQIRERAGIALLDSITLDKIRLERRIELVFECHRYWDLRRWRIAVNELNREFLGLTTILRLPDNNYRFETFPCDGYTRYFDEKMYYLPIKENRININPKLIENPGYLN